MVQYLPLSSVLRFRIVSRSVNKQGCSYYLVAKTTDSNWAIFRTCRELTLQGSSYRLPVVLEGVECLNLALGNEDVFDTVLQKTAPSLKHLRMARTLCRPNFQEQSHSRTHCVIQRHLHRCTNLESLNVETTCLIKDIDSGNLFCTLRDLSLTVDHWDNAVQWLDRLADVGTRRAFKQLRSVSLVASFNTVLPGRQDTELLLQKSNSQGLAPLRIQRLTTLGFPDYIHRVFFQLFNPVSWKTTCRVQSREESDCFRLLCDKKQIGSDDTTPHLLLTELQTSDETLAIIFLSSSPLHSLFFTAANQSCSSELANAIRTSNTIRVFETNYSPTYALYLPERIEAFCVPHTVAAKTLFSRINPFSQEAVADHRVHLRRPLRQPIQSLRTTTVNQPSTVYPIREAGFLTFEDEAELERLSLQCPNLERVVLQRTNDLSVGVVARCLRRWTKLRKLHLLSNGNAKWAETIVQSIDDALEPRHHLSHLYADVCSTGILSEIRRLRLTNVDFSCDIEMSPQLFVSFFSGNPELTIRAANILPGKPLTLLETRAILLSSARQRLPGTYYHDESLLSSTA